jgi:hypothetical protein
MLILNLNDLTKQYKELYSFYDESIEQQLISDLHEIIEDALIKELNLKQVEDYNYDSKNVYTFKKKYNSQVNTVKVLLQNHIESILNDFNLI